MMNGYASYSLVETKRVITVGVSIAVHHGFLRTEVEYVIESEASPKGIQVITNHESPELL